MRVCVVIQSATSEKKNATNKISVRWWMRNDDTYSVQLAENDDVDDDARFI